MLVNIRFEERLSLIPSNGFLGEIVLPGSKTGGRFISRLHHLYSVFNRLIHYSIKGNMLFHYVRRALFTVPG